MREDLQVVCEQCGKQIKVPAERVPDRPFAIACPQCKAKIRVDPGAHAEMVASEPPSELVAAPAPMPGLAFTNPAAARTAPVPIADPNDGFEALRALTQEETELLERLPPTAFLVSEGGETSKRLEAALRFVGMREVERFADVGAAVEALGDAEVGILLVEMDKAPAPPCPPLDPLRQLSPAQRRATFVALAAQNVRSLDGQVAFYLLVNCVLATGEMPRLPNLLRRALLYHLRLYRAWDASLG